MKTSTTQTKTGTIVWATIISGVLDALAAIIAYKLFYNYNPVQIYQFVASGVLGPDAYTGGLPSALLGLAFHFLIAFFASCVFYLLLPRFPFLKDNKIISGLLYGFGIWAVMNLVVIPISKIPAAHFDVLVVIAIIWHMVLVGLPISLIVNRFYKHSRDTRNQ